MKIFKRTVYFGIALVIILSTLTGCGKGVESKIVGTWEFVSYTYGDKDRGTSTYDFDGETVIFSENGLVSDVNNDLGYYIKDSEIVSWKLINDETMALYDERDDRYSVGFKINGKTMTLDLSVMDGSSDYYVDTLVLKKI